MSCFICHVCQHSQSSVQSWRPYVDVHAPSLQSYAAFSCTTAVGQLVGSALTRTPPAHRRVRCGSSTASGCLPPSPSLALALLSAFRWHQISSSRRCRRLKELGMCECWQVCMQIKVLSLAAAPQQLGCLVVAVGALLQRLDGHGGWVSAHQPKFFPFHH